MRIRTRRSSTLIGLLLAVLAVALAGTAAVVRARHHPPTAFPLATGGSYQSSAAMHAAIDRLYPAFASAVPTGRPEWQIPGSSGAWSSCRSWMRRAA